MVTLGSLWLPILLSAIAVFFASFLMHQVLPHHRTDFAKFPDEDGFRAAMHKLNLPAGQYVVPHVASPKEMGTPEFKKKMEEGPTAFLILYPKGPMPMGKLMVQSFVLNLVVAFLVAYLASRTLDPGAHYLGVFRVVGYTTILAYAVSVFYGPIWKGLSWSHAIKEAADGVVYGLLTAGIFGWLWPQ